MDQIFCVKFNNRKIPIETISSALISRKRVKDRAVIKAMHIVFNDEYSWRTLDLTERKWMEWSRKPVFSVNRHRWNLIIILEPTRNSQKNSILGEDQREARSFFFDKDRRGAVEKPENRYPWNESDTRVVGKGFLARLWISSQCFRRRLVHCLSG